MYPGASNTELCPTRFFNGEPLYREGAAPMRPKLSAAARATGSRITMPCVTRCRYGTRASRLRTAMGWPQHPLADPGCLMANCLTSISALRAARVARQVCVSDLRSVCRRRLSHATMVASWRLHHAPLRQTGAAHSRRADGDVSVALHAGSAAVCLSARKAANVQPLLRQMLETMPRLEAAMITHPRRPAAVGARRPGPRKQRRRGRTMYCSKLMARLLVVGDDRRTREQA